jgi:hypothetical protein
MKTKSLIYVNRFNKISITGCIVTPLEYSFKKKSKILQILQLTIYQLICNIHV